MSEPFFVKQDGKFLPQPVCAGPWDPNSLHGRVIVGLLGSEIERQFGGPEYLPARLTVDMYKLPDMSPVEIVVRVVKDGYRIKVIDAEFISAGVSAGRATCQLLRRTENPPGKVWKPAPWAVPKPHEIDPPENLRAAMGGKWAVRPINGGFGVPAEGPRTTWMSEVRELVGGEALTPFVRCAVAADFASPFAHASDQGLGYINTDVSLYLHREPVGEWIGFEVTNHEATAGIAVGECRLHDVEGPVGFAACTALGQKRSPQGPLQPKK